MEQMLNGRKKKRKVNRVRRITYTERYRVHNDNIALKEKMV